jgi:hypothetical protein
MSRQKTFFRHRQDFVSEELTAALLEKASYEFNELFEAIYEKLRARNAVSGGEEMLRLRVYEKLQILVAQGLVKKTARKYSADRRALRARSVEVAAARTAAEQRRGSVLHIE